MNPPSPENVPADGQRRRRRRSSSLSSSSSASSSSSSGSRPVTVRAVERRRPRERDTSTAAASEDPDGAALQRLIISGWIIALSYLPSGLLHAVVGDLVYARDLALMLHLLFSVGWLIKLRQFQWVAKHGWFILITPLMLLPAMTNHLYTLEAVRTAKWSFAWLDWIILGHFIRLDRRWRDEYKLLLWITFLMMGAELLAGLYDWVMGRHLIEKTTEEKTMFGVSRMFDETVGGQIRIRGLQRDVFSFANIMAMNAVAAMAYLLFVRKSSRQITALIWAVAFGAAMFISGGRSAIFGVAAAAIYTVCIFLYPRVAARFEGRYVLAWAGIALTLSLVGVGKFTDFVGSTLLGGWYVGDSESAFMRDDYWTNMMSDFSHHPLILVAGGPAISMTDNQVDPMFHWADNQMLWNAYHLGVLGSVAFAFLFYLVLRPEVRDGQDRKVRQALVLFLVFVIGEGIARESLVLVGCLPLFVLCGYESANELLARRAAPTVSPLRRLRRRSSGSEAGSSLGPGASPGLSPSPSGGGG